MFKIKSVSLSWLLSFVLMMNPLSPAWAADSYTVKDGDSLSKIAKLHFPKTRVYGKDGSLEWIQNLNPKIKNINLIYPGQGILIHSQKELANNNSVDQISERRFSSQSSDETVPAEAPPLNENQIANEEPQSRLMMKMGFDFFRLDSKDKQTQADATFLSNLSPRIEIQWGLRVNPDYSFLAEMKAQNFTIYEDEANSSKQLQKEAATRLGFQGGFYRHWDEASKTGINLGFEERIFNYSPAVNIIKFDKVMTAHLGLTHEKIFWSYKNVFFGSGFQTYFLLPGRGSGYSTKLGYGGEVRGFIVHELKNYSLGADLAYGFENQDSKIVKQTMSQLGFGLNLIWRLE